MNAIIGNFSQESGFKFSAILKGIVLAFFITLVSFFVFSLLIAFTPLPEGFINMIVILTTVVSLFVAGMYCSRQTKSHGLKNGLLLGVIYALVVYLISGIAFKSFAYNLTTLVMQVVCIISAVSGGILGVNVKRRGKRKRHA